jgi:hypothetical protein
MLFKSVNTRKLIKNKKGVVVGIGCACRYYCTFCKQFVISFNHDRHQKSKRHLENVKKYEKENGVVVIENISKLSKPELKKVIKQKFA